MDAKSTPKANRVDYVFVAPDPGRRVVRFTMFLSIIGLCVGVTLSFSDRETWTMVLAGASAVGLLLCWALLQSSIPQRITVRGAIVQIRRDGRIDEFDLEDPGVDIRVKDGEIAFSHYMDRWVVVRSRDVDWKVFSDVVMYWQNRADHNAEERDRRFNR
jgi:hypothetical protein